MIHFSKNIYKLDKINLWKINNDLITISYSLNVNRCFRDETDDNSSLKYNTSELTYLNGTFGDNWTAFPSIYLGIKNSIELMCDWYRWLFVFDESVDIISNIPQHISISLIELYRETMLVV